MPHLDDGVIHELLDGEAPSAQLGPMQQHLASCAECRARLDGERRLRDDVDGLIDVLEVPAVSTPRVVTPPVAVRPMRWVRDLAWAASVVLAVGLGYAARGAPIAPVTSVVPIAPPKEIAADVQTNVKVDQPVTKARKASPPAAPATPTVQAASGSVGALAGDATDRRVDVLAQKATIDTGAAARTVALDPNAASRANRGAAPPSVQMLAGRGGGRGGGRGLNAAARETATLPIDTISLPDAMRRLGGSIRLIDGLVPERLESQGPYVRVVYDGPLVLRQQLVDGKIVFDMLGPPGVAADLLARLRARVKE